MSIAEVQFERVRFLPEHSDIAEHLYTLRLYAGAVDSIAEVGVHDCTSTWAFLLGRPRRYHGFDIKRMPEVDLAAQAAAELGVEFSFHEGNSLEAIVPPVDLLFLDTWHSYDQVLGELRRFARIAKKYIIGHDNVSFAWHDQGSNPDPTKGPEVRAGIGLAIGQYLREDHDWRLSWDKMNCNGLWCLTRLESKNLWKPPFGGNGL